MENIIDTDRIAEAGGRNMDKVVEAVRVFQRGLNGTSRDQLTLSEALSTSDFQLNLGTGFEVQMRSLYQDYTPEWVGLAEKIVAPDFRPVKVRDWFGLQSLERVNELEEYKGTQLSETEIQVKTAKRGLRIDFSWELQRNRDFSNLAEIPRRFANAARRAEDEAAFGALLDIVNGGPSPILFAGAAAASKLPLTAENLETVYGQLALRKDRNGNAVDISKLVLVVHPSQRIAAERLVNAEQIERTVGTVKTTEPNPFRGLFTVKAPTVLANLDKGKDAATTWYVLPDASTASPAVVIAFLQGHENPDIRVLNNQGKAVGGGDVAPEEGSFLDDSISYRVRHLVDAAPAFADSVFASTGTGK